MSWMCAISAYPWSHFENHLGRSPRQRPNMTKPCARN